MSTSSTKFKILYWAVAIFFTAVITAYSVNNPYNALYAFIFAGLILIFYKKIDYGIYAIIFLPVIGELYRVNIASAGDVLISDIFIPVFLVIWIIKTFIINPETKTENLFPENKIPQLTIPIILFICAGVLSLLNALFSLSAKEVLSGSFYLIRFIGYSMLYFVVIIQNQITNLTQSTQHNLIKKIIKASIISGLLLAFAGFIQLQYFPDLSSLQEAGWDPHINRLVSTWLDPNFVGGFFVFLAVIILGLALYSKKISTRVILYSSAIILFAALFFTYSRSAYVALVAAIFIISLLKSRKLIIIASILLLLAYFSSDRARQRIDQLIQSGTSIFLASPDNPDPTAALRIESWQRTFQIIEKHPVLGNGYNTLKYVNLYEGNVQSTNIHSASGSDSSMLTVLATTGVVGLLPFVSIYLLLIISAFIMWKKSNDPFQKGFSLGFLGAIFGLLVHSIFVNSLLFPQIMIFLWITAGILHSLKSSRIQNS